MKIICAVLIALILTGIVSVANQYGAGIPYIAPIGVGVIAGLIVG
jgi:hypothetical protein